eukprot:9503234-Pyramimonas_sp.AAC.1
MFKNVSQTKHKQFLDIKKPRRGCGIGRRWPRRFGEGGAYWLCVAMGVSRRIDARNHRNLELAYNIVWAKDALFLGSGEVV